MKNKRWKAEKARIGRELLQGVPQDKPVKIANTRLAWPLDKLAAELGLSLSFIRREIRVGNLEAVRCGERRLLVLAPAVQTYLKARESTVKERSSA